MINFNTFDIQELNLFFRLLLFAHQIPDNPFFPDELDLFDEWKLVIRAIYIEKKKHTNLGALTP